jgi:hypothetical protein
VLEQHFKELVFQEVHWQRPFEREDVQGGLIHKAGLSFPRGAIVWECRGNKNGARYLLGTEKNHAHKVREAMEPHGNIQFREASERRACKVAVQLKLSTPMLSLRTDCEEAAIRAALAAMEQAGKGDGLVLQIIMGRAYSPTPMPQQLPNPHASWLNVILGNVGTASPESRAAIKERLTLHGFDCCVRLGANTQAGLNRMTSALRVLESPGVRLIVKPEDPAHLNECHIPWRFPLRLCVKELPHLMLLPAGKEDLPLVQGLHPKPLLLPRWYKNPAPSQDRTFAVSLDGTKNLSISPRDSLEHCIITGPTGSGKSTLMLWQAISDIRSGRSILLVDPKGDLASEIATHIPPEREDDVIYIDTNSVNPIGINPLYRANSNPTLVADAILAVFQNVYSENWGIRTLDVLSASLLTLAQVPGATLLWLPALLTDECFRRKITSQISDKVGLGPFWSNFNAMKPSEQRVEVAPAITKLRQFVLRPGLRNVLGQSAPKFDLADLFYKKRIVLLSLNKGTLGSESARLLGSLVVGLTWTLALERASLPQTQRHVTNIYIDELQDYLNLPTDLSDALAQARGLGVSLTLAHQYRDQLPPDIRAGIDANCRNKISFGLQANDAKAYAGMAPELTPEDFMALPRYHVYANFNSGGKSTGWVSGKTFPPPEPTRIAAELYAKSMAKYGRPVEDVEAEYYRQLGYDTDGGALPEPIASEPGDVPTAPVGRRKKDEGDA